MKRRGRDSVKGSGDCWKLYGAAGGAHGKRDDPERQRRNRLSDSSGGRKETIDIKILKLKALAPSRGLPIARRLSQDGRVEIRAGKSLKLTLSQ